MHLSRPFLLTATLLAMTMGGASIITGCATAAYTIQEQFGIEKRDILVDRVGDVAKSQGEAQEEFKDALEAFRAVVAVDAGDAVKMFLAERAGPGERYFHGNSSNKFGSVKLGFPI